jgi:enoyl-[acyl-carrier protein] reductase I
MSYNLLKGKKGLIFGALNSNSIAWKVAERAYEEGAQIMLSNAPMAKRLGETDELAKICCTEVIYADATIMEDLEKLISATLEKFDGKMDFVLHSIGSSPNVRKEIPYDSINYDNYLKTLDISALSFHKILQTCYKLDAINEWGSIVALTYIASTRTLYGYNDMADAKATLESIARSFGYIYGREKHVRVNTISQSPTVTSASGKIQGFNSLLDFSERMSPLGNADALECANYVITLFSDLTKKVTMQNLFNDGGFSSMGMSQEAMLQYDKSFEECK